MTNKFIKSKYLNLETYRRSGIGVRTPVWFVLANDQLYIQTIENSGKVKRIRNNSQVNFTTCRGDGKPTGTWQQGHCQIVHDETLEKKVDLYLEKKYGFLKKWFSARQVRQGLKAVLLVIQPDIPL